METTTQEPGQAQGLDALFPDLPTIEGRDLETGKSVTYKMRGLTFDDMFSLLRIAKHAVVWGSIEAGAQGMPDSREKLLAMLVFGCSECAGPAADWLGGLLGMTGADFRHQPPRFALRTVQALNEHPDFRDFFVDLAENPTAPPEWAMKIWRAYGNAPSTESSTDTDGPTEQ